MRPIKHKPSVIYATGASAKSFNTTMTSLIGSVIYDMTADTDPIKKCPISADRPITDMIGVKPSCVFDT